MKTNTQGNFIPRLLAIAFFFTASSAAFGQEFIRESSTEASRFSIVRSVSSDSTLIYSWEPYDDVAQFIMSTTGNSTPDAMYIEKLFVNDFEIFDGKVYFCGYTYSNYATKAVFGFFYLSQFPNCSINCNILNDCCELKQLDVCKTVYPQFMGETHMIMTGGTTNNRTDVLVDVVKPINASFTGEIHISYNENEFFDDVAVTKEYVVVSSRNKVNGIPVIDYLQFSKPVSAGQTIFSSSADVIRVSSPVANTTVLLEHTGNNKYASVYKNSGYPQMEMLLLEAPGTISNGITIYGGDENRTYPLDIKYNSWYNVYDILAQGRSLVYGVKTQIDHVTSAELNNTSTLGTVTMYQDDLLSSIASHNTSSSNFVASGAGSYQRLLRLYSYKHNVWDLCPQKINYQYCLGKPEIIISIRDFEGFVLDSRPITMVREPKEFDFPIECGQDSAN